MKIEKYLSLFVKQNYLEKPISIKQLILFFKRLQDGIKAKDPLSLIIAEYLAINIASETKRKRKVSAREFEDFLAIAFEGKVMDTESRKTEMPEATDSFVEKYIISNRREKMDVIFSSKYGISVKTSVPNNNEINMGAFAREALFYEILDNYGSERKGGLGSKPQIKATFEKIKEVGKWGDFCERFAVMVKGIYADDLIVAEKGGENLSIFFVSSEKLQKLLIDAVKGGPNETIKVLNRYEGNSLRIDRRKVSEVGQEIVLEFTDLKNSKVKKVLDRLEDIEEKTLDGLISGDVNSFKRFIVKEIGSLIEEMKSD